MRRGLQFTAITALICFGGAWGIVALRPDVARELWSSAVLAFVVQVISFGIADALVLKNAIGAWGIGSGLRFLVVFVYALFGAKALGLSLTPALLSLVTFLFVTMLVESLFLKR